MKTTAVTLHIQKLEFSEIAFRGTCSGENAYFGRLTSPGKKRKAESRASLVRISDQIQCGALCTCLNSPTLAFLGFALPLSPYVRPTVNVKIHRLTTRPKAGQTKYGQRPAYGLKLLSLVSKHKS